MLGYDTPERGECGFTEATNALRSLLASGIVTELRDGDNQDRYDLLDGYDRHTSTKTNTAPLTGHTTAAPARTEALGDGERVVPEFRTYQSLE